MVKQNQVDIKKSAKTGQKNQHKIVSEIFLKNKKKKTKYGRDSYSNISKENKRKLKRCKKNVL